MSYNIGPPNYIYVNGKHINEFTQLLGKKIRILTDNYNHPKIKFEKVLPYPEYECWFEGVLEKAIESKYQYSLWLNFTDVDFEGRKKNKPKKDWSLCIHSIIKWTIL